MSFSGIRKTLVKFWNDSNTLAIPTAYENDKFEPPSDVAWCHLYVIPASTVPATLGLGGEDEHTGIFQITFYVPLNTGDSDLLAALDGIEALYYAGKKTTYLGQEVLFTGVSRSPAREVGGWYAVDVSISYYARDTRSTS